MPSGASCVMGPLGLHGWTLLWILARWETMYTASRVVVVSEIPSLLSGCYSRKSITRNFMNVSAAIYGFLAE